MLAPKKHNKRPRLAFILWGIIRRHIQNRSKFHIQKWTVSTQSQLFQVIFKQAARRKGVVPLLLLTSRNFIFWYEDLQKLSMSKEKLWLVGSSGMTLFLITHSWKWPFYTRNAMIMWIHMLIGVSETFFNFKYNVALFLKLYMLIKSLGVFFRVQLEKNVALPIFLLWYLLSLVAVLASNLYYWNYVKTYM